MSDVEENIFLRAALKGEIIQPSFSKKGEKEKTERKRVTHRYSQMQDLMLMRVVEKCGREWRSVINDEMNSKAGSNDKKQQKRLQKRATKILRDRHTGGKVSFLLVMIVFHLNMSRLNTLIKTSFIFLMFISTRKQVSTIEEEYRPKINYSSNSNANSDTPVVEEMSLITVAINYRDKKCLNAR